MHPYLRIGDWVVEGYALFFILGWLVGGAVFYLEVRRRGWPLDKLLFAMAGCILGAVVGALLAGILFFDWPEVVSHLTTLELVGKSVVGGIAGGFAGVEIAKKLVRYPHSTGDAFAIAIPLGHAVGRIGCFLGGCCFGSATTLPWAVRYTNPASMAPQLGVAYTPANLYEAVGILLILGVLLYLRRRGVPSGVLGLTYLVLYPVSQLILFQWRTDYETPVIAFGLKQAQLTSVVMLLTIVPIFFLLWLRSRPKGEVDATAEGMIRA